MRVATIAIAQSTIAATRYQESGSVNHPAITDCIGPERDCKRVLSGGSPNGDYEAETFQLCQ
jgi:hypothetical protein